MDSPCNYGFPLTALDIIVQFTRTILRGRNAEIRDLCHRIRLTFKSIEIFSNLDEYFSSERHDSVLILIISGIGKTHEMQS